MPDLFKDYGKLVGNELAQVIDDKPLKTDPTAFYDTGSYMMNALISGDMYKGIPNNTWTVFAGEQATGKTFIALSVVKHFLDNYEDGKVFWFDSENAITREMATSRGIPFGRVQLIPIDTVEKFKTQVFNWLELYNSANEADKFPAIIVLDSLGMLATSKTIEDTQNQKEVSDMTKQKKIKDMVTVIGLRLMEAKIPLIVNNHVYESMSMYGGKQMSGGSGIKYSSSTTVFLSKRKDKVGTEQVGNIITARADKSRFTIENSKAELLLNFKTGLNRYHGLLSVAEEAGIFKRVGHRYETPDGKKLYQKEIMANPEKYFTPEVLNILNQKVKELYCYGEHTESDVVEDSLVSPEHHELVNES